MLVLATMDQTPHGDLLHVSLIYPNRLPSWEDLRQVKDAFFGDDLDAMMVIPKAEDYINVHQYCFHIWQTPRTWGLL